MVVSVQRRLSIPSAPRSQHFGAAPVQSLEVVHACELTEALHENGIAYGHVACALQAELALPTEHAGKRPAPSATLTQHTLPELAQSSGPSQPIETTGPASELVGHDVAEQTPVAPPMESALTQHSSPTAHRTASH